MCDEHRRNCEIAVTEKGSDKLRILGVEEVEDRGESYVRTRASTFESDTPDISFLEVLDSH